MDEMADTIRAAVAAVTDVDVQVEPRMIMNPTPPCIDIYPGDPSTDASVAGFGDRSGGEIFTVRARVGTADTDAGQDLLLAFMDDEGELSLWDAIEDEPTLNSLASDVEVQSRSGFVAVPDADGGTVRLGCLWSVLVIKAHS